MIATPIADQPAFEWQRVVKGIRAARRWTQARLGAELGVSAQVIASWERARSQPNARDMPMLRAMLAGWDEGMSAHLRWIGEVEQSARDGEISDAQRKALIDVLERCLVALAEVQSR